MLLKFYNYSISFFLLLMVNLISPNKSEAQRDYYYRDSTTYFINNQVSYVAGKRHLYKWNEKNLELIKDFTVLGDSSFYIRDVDFIDSNTGYVVVGSIYIGNDSKLYFTQNGGVDWDLDTSYYSASLHKSINQMQVLKDGTLVLFDGYYESSVLRSTDGGKSWKLWLNSLIAHYFQLFECENGVRYLMGLPGDGFSSYSFRVEDTLWSKTDLKNYFNGCFTFGNTCIRVLRDGARDRETDFIQKQQDTLAKVCLKKVELRKISPKKQIELFPNPAIGEWTIKLESFQEPNNFTLEILDIFGKVVFTFPIKERELIIEKNRLMKAGSYIVRVIDANKAIQFSQILVVY